MKNDETKRWNVTSEFCKNQLFWRESSKTTIFTDFFLDSITKKPVLSHTLHIDFRELDKIAQERVSHFFLNYHLVLKIFPKVIQFHDFQNRRANFISKLHVSFFLDRKSKIK